MRSPGMSDIKAAFLGEDIELLKMVGTFLENEGACEALGDITAHRPFAQVIFEDRTEALHGKNDELEKVLDETLSFRRSRGPLGNFALAHLLWGWCDINRQGTELRRCLYSALVVVRNAMSDEVEKALAGAATLETTLTPEQVAEKLDVSVETLEKWRSGGSGPPFYKLPGGGKVRYSPTRLREWLENQRKSPEE